MGPLQELNINLTSRGLGLGGQNTMTDLSCKTCLVGTMALTSGLENGTHLSKRSGHVSLNHVGTLPTWLASREICWPQNPCGQA